MWTESICYSFLNIMNAESFLNTILLYLQGIFTGQTQDCLDAVIVNSCILFSAHFKVELYI